MTNFEALLTGYPIYIATIEIQRRKHHKKRIDKKWRKRYGIIEFNTMPDGQVFFNEATQALYMTRKTFEKIKKEIGHYDEI